MNGWSKDGSTGWCSWEPTKIFKREEETCHHWDGGCIR